MILVQLTIRLLFGVVCGWLGHMLVRALTLGRVDLDWGAGSESVIAEWLGLFLVLLLAGLLVGIFHR
jgi:hypothetical protein